MIVTPRCAKWLQHLPESEAAALIDAVVEVAAAPLDSGPRCKKLAPNLYEARLTLPHRRQMRVMFGYRDGTPVLLTALEKRDSKRHQAEIDHARAALTSDDIPQESAMPKEPPIFHVTSWVYSSDGKQLRIVHHTRRRVVVDTDPGRVEWRRARLERSGEDVVNGITYRTTKYWLPCEAQELTS